MKKIILSIIFCLVTLSALADWNMCPFGRKYDKYPGNCERYKDANGNDICDYSELSPDWIMNLFCRRSETNPTESQSSQNTETGRIHMIPIFSILLVLYLGSHLLSNKGVISLALHRKIWNFLLLISFIMTAGTSLLIILRMDYQIIVQVPFNILYWHTETGIVTISISLFHIIWHWDYFKRLLKK